MNLVDILKNQLLSPSHPDKLGSPVGESPDTTEKAGTGGMPGLLAGLMKLAGNSGGHGQLFFAWSIVTGIVGHWFTVPDRAGRHGKPVPCKRRECAIHVRWD